MSSTLIKSPLNYTGGKYKLLPQILSFFPEKVPLFIDLFCGGGNVGINVQQIILSITTRNGGYPGCTNSWQT